MAQVYKNDNFHTRTAFRRVSVKSTRHPETFLRKCATSIVERVLSNSIGQKLLSRKVQSLPWGDSIAVLVAFEVCRLESTGKSNSGWYPHKRTPRTYL